MTRRAHCPHVTSEPRDGLVVTLASGTCRDCVETVPRDNYDDDPFPPDPFDRVVEEVLHLNRSKRSDYTGGRGPWANFEDTAAQVGTTPAQVVEMMIANKQSRLRSLSGTDRTPNHEAVRDTLLDRAVYSIIALAMYDEGHYGQAADA